MKIQRSIEIAAPPEKIWPYLVEPERIMKWFTFLRKFEYTSKKCSGVGATFYYEEKSGPQLMKLHYKIIEWAENNKLSFVLASGSLKKDDQTWALEATPSGSRFTMTEEVEMPWGIIGKALDKMVGGMIGNNIEKIIGNLKTLVETEG